MKILFVGNFGLEYQRMIPGQRIHVFLWERKISEREQNGGKESWFKPAWRAGHVETLQVCNREVGCTTWWGDQSKLKTPYVIPYDFLSSVNTERLYLRHSVRCEIRDEKFWSLPPV